MMKTKYVKMIKNSNWSTGAIFEVYCEIINPKYGYPYYECVGNPSSINVMDCEDVNLVESSDGVPMHPVTHNRIKDLEEQVSKCNVIISGLRSSTARRYNEGYQDLHNTLMSALDQAQNGKGKERHASDGQSFCDQPIMTITGLVGTGYTSGQAIKKIVEPERLPNEASIKELLGAINYIAAQIIHIKKEGEL